MTIKRLFMATTLAIGACLAIARATPAEEGDNIVPLQANATVLRPIAVNVSNQRQAINGKVLILIPSEFMGNRDLQILNERIKTALIFAEIPPLWTKSIYYDPQLLQGRIDPHQVHIVVVNFQTDLFALRYPEVPDIPGMDQQAFSDEAKRAKGAPPMSMDEIISHGKSAPLRPGPFK